MYPDIREAVRCGAADDNKAALLALASLLTHSNTKWRQHPPPHLVSPLEGPLQALFAPSVGDPQRKEGWWWDAALLIISLMRD